MSNSFFINYRALADGYNWNPKGVESKDKDASKINGRDDLKDGLTKEEMAAMDTNGDGLLTESEFKTAYNNGNNYLATWNAYTVDNKNNFGTNPDGSKWQNLDPNDKRTATTVFDKNGKIDYYVIKEQNDDGSVSNKRYKANGEFHWGNKIYTDENGNKEYFIYGDEKLTSLLRKEYYNELGIATGYEYLDESGNTCLVTYDETTGKPTSFTKTSPTGEELYKEEYAYDDYDKDKVVVNTYENGELKNEISYNNGVVTKRMEYASDGKVYEYQYETNANEEPLIRKYDTSTTPKTLISRDIVEIYDIAKDENGNIKYDAYGQKIKEKRSDKEIETDRNNIWSQYPTTIFNSFYDFKGNVATNINKIPTTKNNINMATFSANNVHKCETFEKANKDYGLNDYSLLENSTSKDNNLEELRQKVLDAKTEAEISVCLLEYEVALQNSYKDSNSLDTDALVKQLTQRNKELIKKEKNTRIKTALEKLNTLLADYPEKTTMDQINKQLQEIRNARLAA